jgi:hypothetical protein
MPLLLKSSLVLGITLLCTDIAVSQVRTFTERPQVLLGLRTNRSPFIALVDIDGDGDLDALVANGRHWPQQNEVFINNGSGRFMMRYPLGTDSRTSYSIPTADPQRHLPQ